MDENTVLDEIPAEETPRTEKKSPKGRHSKPKRNKKKNGGKKGLTIALCIILALTAIAAVFVFVVYGGVELPIVAGGVGVYEKRRGGELCRRRERQRD